MKMIQTEPKCKTPSAPPAATMSSREIAELVESRHDKVKQSIERLASRGVIDVPPLGEYLDALGRPAKDYQLEKRDSFVVVAQLSPEFTARLVDRWQELEQEKAEGGFLIPRSLGDALQLAANQAREIEDLREAATAHDRLTAAIGAVCVSDAAKVLGIAPRTLFDWLASHRWTFRRDGGAWVGYAEKCAAGLLDHRVFTQLRTDGREVARTQVLITPKGLSRLAQLITPTAKVLK